MAVYKVSNSTPYNGCRTHTITAQDVTDGYVEFDFENSYTLIANVMCIDSTNAVVSIEDVVITFPSAGKIRIAVGSSTGVFVAGNKLLVFVERDNSQFI